MGLVFIHWGLHGFRNVGLPRHTMCPKKPQVLEHLSNLKNRFY